MNLKEESIFYELLRAALWGTPLQPEKWGHEGWEWKNILKNLEHQTILGLCTDVILRLPAEYLPDAEQQQLVQGRYMNSVKRHFVLNSTLIEVFGYLKQHGIRPILFKGQGLASLYPNPLLRQCGDIDIYIGPENYEKAKQVIEELVQEPAQLEEATESEKHYHIDYHSVTLELHRLAEVIYVPWRNKYYQRLTQHWLEEVEPATVNIQGTEVPVPPTQFNVMYVFYHLWHHFIRGGVGLRQICDWAMLLHRSYGQYDRNELEQDLKKCGLMRAWKTVGCLVVDRLGLPEQEFPFYDAALKSKAEACHELIQKGGNFGKYSRDWKKRDYLARKIYGLKLLCKQTWERFRLDTFTNSTGTLLSMFLQKTWTFLQGK